MFAKPCTGRGKFLKIPQTVDRNSKDLSASHAVSHKAPGVLTVTLRTISGPRARRAIWQPMNQTTPPWGGVECKLPIHNAPEPILPDEYRQLF